MIALAISIMAWAFITANYGNPWRVFGNITSIYSGSWDGFRSRVTEGSALKNRYERSLGKIRDMFPIPALQGTTDIYSAGQSNLLASNNKWNPRPIFQSYSVYTDILAKINEQHLRADNAPDNVLFRAEPIDGRLPSLEDGLSWPALFDNYTLTKLDTGYDLAYLRKKQVGKKNSTFHVVHEGTHKTGEDVVLPMAGNPIFAEVDLRPTLFGKLYGVAFKPPQLQLKLKLKDGTIIGYRVVSSMMRSGFFISPLVQNTENFVALASGNQRYLEKRTVESIAITPSYGDAILWDSIFTLKLKAYRGDETATNVPELLYLGKSSPAPDGYDRVTLSTCDGAIDAINPVTPAQRGKKVTRSLLVRGWLAVSAKGGIAPDDIFVTVRARSGGIAYIKAQRIPRNDVKVHYNQPTMPDVGYTATIDASMLEGEYLLGLARGFKGELVNCTQFNVAIRIGKTELR